MSPARLLDEIRFLVGNGHYIMGTHAVSHMAEEGFEKEHIVGAVLSGRLLEIYASERRYLIAGRFRLSARNECPLHVVCELTSAAHENAFGPQADQIVRFVTAYIPRPPAWISPHVRA